MTTKKQVKKNSAKKSMTMKSSSQPTTMRAYCIQCKKEVSILDIKKETFKGKGKTLRARIVGKCENGHKFFRFAKAD